MSRLPVFPPGLQRSNASPDSVLQAQGRGLALASSRDLTPNRTPSTFDDVLTEFERDVDPSAITQPLLAQAIATTTLGFLPGGVSVEPPPGNSIATVVLDSGNPHPGSPPASEQVPPDIGGAPGTALRAALGSAVNPLPSTASGEFKSATSLASAEPPELTSSPPGSTALTDQAPGTSPSQSRSPDLNQPGSTTTNERLLRLLQQATAGEAVTAAASRDATTRPVGPQLNVAGPVRVISVRSERLTQPQTPVANATQLSATPAATATTNEPVSALALRNTSIETGAAHLAGDDGLDVFKRDSSEAGSRSRGVDTSRIDNAQTIESRTNTATVSKVDAAAVSQQIARTVVQRFQWETVDARTQMTLELQPASLGTVQVVLELERKELTIQIITQTESIRAVVEAQLNDLTTLLRQAGIDFSGCDVTCQDSEADKWEDTHGRRSGSEAGQPTPSETEADHPESMQTTHSDDGAIDLVA